MADHPPLTTRRVFVGTTLTAVGGFVDCFGYLTLSNVYTATMSGNTVLIAVQGGRGETSAALLHAYTVGVFVLGLLVASIVIELGLRRGIRRVLALALAVEAACLAAVALWGAPIAANRYPGTATAPHWPLFLLIGLTAVAMGTQNTSLRMAGIMSIFTTHVTGSLTRFAEQFAAYLFVRSPQARADRLAQSCFAGGLWLAFFFGALVASELLPRWGASDTLAVPIAVILAIIGIDILEPLAEPQAPRPSAG